MTKLNSVWYKYSGLTRLSIVLTLLAVCSVYGQQKRSEPDAAPQLRIKSATVPRKLDEPLLVTFEMATKGKTPVALGQEQFGFEISCSKAPMFYGNLMFSNLIPSIIAVQTNVTMTISAYIFTNHLGRSWTNLESGEWNLRLSTGSGKTRQFDFQWMGQVHSDTYRLKFN